MNSSAQNAYDLIQKMHDETDDAIDNVPMCIEISKQLIEPLENDKKRLAKEVRQLSLTNSDNDAVIAEQLVTIKRYQAELAMANAHNERLTDKRPLDVRMKEAGMITLTEIWSGMPIDNFIKTKEVTTLDYFEKWLESRYKEVSSMFAKRTVEKEEDDDMYEWVLAHSAVFKEVLLNFKQVKQSLVLRDADTIEKVAAKILCSGQPVKHINYALRKKKEFLDYAQQLRDSVLGINSSQVQ